LYCSYDWRDLVLLQEKLFLKLVNSDTRRNGKQKGEKDKDIPLQMPLQSPQIFL
jgi:hypothetical protein